MCVCVCGVLCVYPPLARNHEAYTQIDAMGVGGMSPTLMARTALEFLNIEGNVG